MADWLEPGVALIPNFVIPEGRAAAYPGPSSSNLDAAAEGGHIHSVG
jgi:hypothetical protein